MHFVTFHHLMTMRSGSDGSVDYLHTEICIFKDTLKSVIHSDGYESLETSAYNHITRMLTGLWCEMRISVGGGRKNQCRLQVSDHITQGRNHILRLQTSPTTSPNLTDQLITGDKPAGYKEEVSSIKSAPLPLMSFFSQGVLAWLNTSDLAFHSS